MAPAARAVVLVEGINDQRAFETLAERRGRGLDVEGVRIVPIGGAHAIGRFRARFGRVADPDEQAAAIVFLKDSPDAAPWRGSARQAGSPQQAREWAAPDRFL